MKLQIMSDLHLAFGEPVIPQTDADLIVLAGDIGRPRQAIRWAYGLGKPVLYVPGNHEFYGGVIAQVLSEMRGLAAGTNIRVLDDDEAIIDGVRFLGCTLWTDLSLFGEGADRELAVRAAWQYMRDFALIRTQGNKLFSPDDMVSRCRQHLAWLEKRLDEHSDVPTVVITHHAPSRRSIHSSFKGAPINAAYIVDLERLLGAQRVRLWIHGHTHFSFDYQVNGTRVICNPRGYALNGIEQNLAFDAGLVVEI
jgi:predicted phosphodiesterase